MAWAVGLNGKSKLDNGDVVGGSMWGSGEFAEVRAAWGVGHDEWWCPAKGNGDCSSKAGGVERSRARKQLVAVVQNAGSGERKVSRPDDVIWQFG